MFCFCFQEDLCLSVEVIQAQLRHDFLFAGRKSKKKECRRICLVENERELKRVDKLFFFFTCNNNTSKSMEIQE